MIFLRYLYVSFCLKMKYKAGLFARNSLSHKFFFQCNYVTVVIDLNQCNYANVIIDIRYIYKLCNHSRDK